MKKINLLLIAILLVSCVKSPDRNNVGNNYVEILPGDTERWINKNSKAIMPVHMGEQSANMERFWKMAKKYNLFIIEDACQAHFAKYQGKMIGTIGPIYGINSFSKSQKFATLLETDVKYRLPTEKQ